MSISAAQIREARRLLRRSSAWLCRQSDVEFTLVLKAQLDADIASLDLAALEAIERVLTKAGVDFPGDSAFLRKSATGVRGSGRQRRIEHD